MSLTIQAPLRSGASAAQRQIPRRRGPSRVAACCAQHRDGASHRDVVSQPSSSGRILIARRQALLGPLLSAALAAGVPAQQAWAADATAAPQLPKAYQEVVRKLAKSLRESIEAEQAGQSEADVRRKAEGAKEALQTFVRRWTDDPKVKGHPSHQRVLAVLQELSAFFQTSGPRARMPSDLQARLLTLVADAEEALSSPQVGKPAPRPRAPALGGAQEEDEGLLRELLPSA